MIFKEQNILSGRAPFSRDFTSPGEEEDTSRKGNLQYAKDCRQRVWGFGGV